MVCLFVYKKEHLFLFSRLIKDKDHLDGRICFKEEVTNCLIAIKPRKGSKKRKIVQSLK